MALASLDDIGELVLAFLDAATDAAGLIVFNEGRKAFKMAEARRRLALLGAQPHFAELPEFYGMAAWSAVLSVDLRDSAGRARRVGARNTYIAMHVLLPTMAELVGRGGGSVIGLRGDGLIASFGLVRLDTGAALPPKAAQREAVFSAATAGRAMLEAVDKLINPALEDADLPAELQIGIGIDVGHIVVTRIGLDDVQEVTVYGDCVNDACHMKPDGFVMLSHEADLLYPVAPRGRLWSEPADGENVRLCVPTGMNVLD